MNYQQPLISQQTKKTLLETGCEKLCSLINFLSWEIPLILFCLLQRTTVMWQVVLHRAIPDKIPAPPHTPALYMCIMCIFKSGIYRIYIKLQMLPCAHTSFKLTAVEVN